MFGLVFAFGRVSFGNSVVSFTSIVTAIPVSLTIYLHEVQINWHLALSLTVRYGKIRRSVISDVFCAVYD
jgi:hypothetical protein